MQNIKIDYARGKQQLFPTNKLVNNWLFEEGEESEALLCHHLAEVAEKNGLSSNDMQHLFPAVLRMVKSDIMWANNIK